MLAKIINIYKKTLNIIGLFEKWFGIFLLSSLVIIMNAQVFFRYVLGNAIVWAEEYLIYAFIVAIFVGASYGYKKKRHTTITTLVERLPSNFKYFYFIFKYSIIILACIALLIGGSISFQMESRQTTISLPIVLPRYLFYSVPILYCATSIIFTSIYEIILLIIMPIKKFDKQIQEEGVTLN